MKWIFSILLASLPMVSAAYVGSGGDMDFGNLNGTGTISLGPYSRAGEGNVGDLLGGDYNVSLYYSTIPVSGPVDPLSLTLYSPATIAFFGTTGPSPLHGINTDGAGYFDSGNTIDNEPGIPGVVDGQTLYVEAAAWYSGPGATDYASAQALGYNVGHSVIISVRMSTGPDQIIGDMSAMPSFEVGVVPEPTTIALGAFGGAALLLFRRRK